MSDSSTGWRLPIGLIITCGCLIAMITFGARAGFGLYLGDISTQFFAGQTAVLSLSLAIQNLIWGAASPVAGIIADKWGSGRVLAGGAVLYAAGLAAVPYSDTPLMMHLTAGVAIGLGVAFASFAIVLASFSRKVSPERRALAVGAGTAFGSVGQLTLVPLANWVMVTWDWQMALFVMASLVLLVIPLAMTVTGTGEPDADNPDQTVSQAFREAFGYRSYLLLIAGFFVCGFHVAFIQVHLPKYVEGQGLPLWVGGAAIAVVGGFNIIGTFAAAWLSGRIGKRYTLSLIYTSRAIAITIYVLMPISIESTLVFAAVMGLFWLSTVPPTSGLVAQFFGLRYMASLFGVVFFSHQMGSFIGVWLAGELFDATGSYALVWWISAGLGVFAALIHLPIKEAPVPRPAAAAAA